MKKLLLIALLTGLLSITGSYQTSSAQDFGPPPNDGSVQKRNSEGPGFRGGEHKQGGMKQGQQRGKDHFMQMMKDLNLSEDQKAKLKANKEKNKGKMESLRNQMKTEREKFMELMSNANSTKPELLAQQNKVSSIQNKIEEIRIDDMITLREILTPEQNAKFQKKMSEMHAKMKEKMQNRNKGNNQNGPKANKK